MKKILMISLLSLWMVSNGLAHPPSQIFVNYDTKEELLIVWVTHPVGQTESPVHFINKVKVIHNGIEKVEAEYFLAKEIGRKRGDHFCFTMKNIKVGDTIEVQAFCSQGGSFSKTVIVDESFFQ